MIHIKVDRESINFLIAVYQNHCRESLPGPSESDHPSAQSPLDEVTKQHLNETIVLATERPLWDKLAGAVSLTGANEIVQRVQGLCRRLLNPMARALL